MPDVLVSFAAGFDDVLTWRDAVSIPLLILGGLLSILSGIGMHRMPDFFSRIHAAGLSDVPATACIMIALLFQAGSLVVAGKLFLIFLFLLFTAPVSSHVMARAAMEAGVSPWTPCEPPQEEA